MATHPAGARAARLFLLTLLAAPLAAQAPVLNGVSPSQGTLGTEVVISGLGFPEQARPRVWLEFPSAEAGGKPVRDRMRVLESSATQIRARVLKAQVGSCQLVVKVPHSPELVAPFKIAPPAVSSFIPASAHPGDKVVIFGSNFGSRRVKVQLFNLNCRVLDWDNNSISLKVPAALPNGEWTPFVRTKLADAAAKSALLVSGSLAVLPPEFVTAQVGPALFLAEDTAVVAANVGSKLAFDGYATTLDGVQQHLSVLVPYSVLTTKPPKLFTGTTAGTQPLTWQETPPGSGPPSVYAAKPGVLPWQVQVLGRSQGAVFGRLQATLSKVSGPGEPTLPMDDGMFLVKP